MATSLPQMPASARLLVLAAAAGCFVAAISSCCAPYPVEAVQRQNPTAGSADAILDSRVPLQQPDTINPGTDLDPAAIFCHSPAFAAAEARGRADAQEDIAKGVLAIETSGLPLLPPGYLATVYAEAGIELRVVAGCEVDEEIWGHETGYNDVVRAEVETRRGHGFLDSLGEEARLRWWRDR